jgi:hypothetical protein
VQVGTYPTRNFAESCYLLTNPIGITGLAGWAFPPTSPRRRGARTISSSRRIHDETVGVWSLRILCNPESDSRVFPADFPHLSHCHCDSESESRVVEDPPGFPAYSRLRTASSPTRGAAASRHVGGISYLRHSCYRHSIRQTFRRMLEIAG